MRSQEHVSFGKLRLCFSKRGISQLVVRSSWQLSSSAGCSLPGEHPPPLSPAVVPGAKARTRRGAALQPGGRNAFPPRRAQKDRGGHVGGRQRAEAHPKICFISRVWESSGAAAARQRGEPFAWVFLPLNHAGGRPGQEEPPVRCSPACVMLPRYAGVTDGCGMRCASESPLDALTLRQRATREQRRGESQPRAAAGISPPASATAKATSAGVEVTGCALR